MSDTEQKAPATDSTDAALLATIQPPSETKPEEKAAPVATQQEPSKESTTEPAKKEEKAVPQTYTLKLPEGSLLKPEQLEKISSFAKEKGLSESDAQALLERESSVVSEFQSEQLKAWEDTKTKWVESIKSDKEIGGPAFEKNVQFAKKAVDRFASPEFKKSLEETGFGNHPELVRVFARIGKAMASDQLIRGGEAPQRKSTEELLYGNSKK